MSYLALYRKYRPSDFEDVVGQDKVIKVISNAVTNNRVSHAYLFSGPRGTGKTTTAKILARMVNCKNLIDGKPCGKCQSCINILNSSDIVEIDAASNNGVDEIRELRDKANLVPTSSKYKIYIIDEVHMLTTQAFNALLKTLEEPPSHIIFILATTEVHKIPLTVSSRCQKFQFTKISDDKIVERLKYISDSENIKVSEEALYEIARLADGGLRDAINLLDQLAAYVSDDIKLEDVYKINGSVSYIELYNLLSYINDGKSKEIINFIEDIDKNGKNVNKFIEEIIIFLKDVLLYKNAGQQTMILEKNSKIEIISKKMDEVYIYTIINDLNELLTKIKVANYPSILLIVTLLKLAKKNEKSDIAKEEIKTNIVKENKDTKNLNVSKEEKIHDVDKFNIKKKVVDNNIINIRVNNTLATAKKELLIEIKNSWNKIDNYLLDNHYSMVAGLLNDSNPVVVGDNNIIISTLHESLAERINESSVEVSALLNQIYDRNFLVVAISSKKWDEEKKKYIENIKNGILYTKKEEPNEKENKDVEINDSVASLVELLGEDLIEYK